MQATCCRVGLNTHFYRIRRSKEPLTSCPRITVMPACALTPKAAGQIRRHAVSSVRRGKLCGMRPLPQRACTAASHPSSREQGAHSSATAEAAPSVLQRVKAVLSSTAARWLGALALAAVMVRFVPALRASLLPVMHGSARAPHAAHYDLMDDCSRGSARARGVRDAACRPSHCEPLLFPHILLPAPYKATRLTGVLNAVGSGSSS